MKTAVVLRSSKAITKETMEVAARSGRPSPDPELSSVVELLRRHLHRTLDLTGIGKALARERIAAEEAPPSLLLTRASMHFWE